MNDINLTNDKKLEIIEKVINAKGLYGLLEEIEKMKSVQEQEVVESIPPVVEENNYSQEDNNKPSIYSERGFEAMNGSGNTFDIPSEGKRLVKTNPAVPQGSLPNNFSDAEVVSPGYMNR